MFRSPTKLAHSRQIRYDKKKKKSSEQPATAQLQLASLPSSPPPPPPPNLDRTIPDNAMTSTQPTSQPPSGARPSPRDGASSSWIPPIPRPLERLFDLVPLVTYAPNELPYRSPAAAAADTGSLLPTLHVFTSEEDAARGAPSFNPSCLKWQAYLRFAGISHALAPSTNHASPTGSLPFLQPALPSSPEHRLDPRTLLPIPSSRLDSYARQHGSLPSSSSTSADNTTTTTAPAAQTPDQRYRRQEAYQALLDNPIRAAWLYALYLSPANEPLLRHLYVDRVSRSGPVRATTLQQLRAAARAEIVKTTTTTTTPGWSVSGNVGDLLTWALGGRTVVDPGRVYDDARRAFGALETLLSSSEGGGGGEWLFGSAHPTLFDASVFSYTHLVLSDEYKRAVPWGDDTLRRIVRDDCPLLVAHARRILERYW